MAPSRTRSRGQPNGSPESRATIRAAWITAATTVLGGVLIAGLTTSWFGLTSSDSEPPTPVYGASSGGNGGSGSVLEYGDNRNGSPVFADPEGHPVASNVQSIIPFGTEVTVRCYAPNEAGMASVSAFYLIASGPWKGTYVVADTMSNGGPPGNTSSPNVDPRVKKCP